MVFLKLYKSDTKIFGVLCKKNNMFNGAKCTYFKIWICFFFCQHCRTFQSPWVPVMRMCYKKHVGSSREYILLFEKESHKYCLFLHQSMTYFMAFYWHINGIFFPLWKSCLVFLLIPHTYVTLPSQAALQRITINLVVDVTGLLGAQRQYQLVCRIEQRENHRFQVDRRQDESVSST